MIARHWSHFILGGVRSGKSRYALTVAQSARRHTAFVATARAADDDIRVRIARHRAERPSDWLTVEEPLDLVGACRQLPGRVDLALIDCLTLWVSNRLLRGDEEAAIVSAAEDLARLLGQASRSWVIVSNEVGEGVHPSTSAGLRFRDVLGLVNQRVAAAAEQVTLMVAGIPLSVKERRQTASGFGAAPGHDIAQQTP